MLQLVSKDEAKKFWLVGPQMKVGSDRGSEIYIQSDVVASLHATLVVDQNQLTLIPSAGHSTTVNESAINGKTLINKGDVIRFADVEFVLVDPQEEKAKKAAGVSSATAINGKPVDDTEATLFRQKSNAAGAGSGWMLQALHASLKNKRYPLEGTMSLGRSNECELSFAHDRLSRKHAEFKVFDGTLFVKDLDSSNGMFHNGQKVMQAKLTNGDTIAFDKLEFSVIAPKPAEEALGEVNMNETVMRSAITPEMIKKATAAADQNNAQATLDEKAPESSSSSNALIIVGVVIAVAAIGAFAAFM